MAENERNIVKIDRNVNGVDIVVFIHDIAKIILKSKTYVDAFVRALTRFLSKVITIDIPESARNITVFIGDTIGEIKLGWRESKMNLDIRTLEMITEKYGSALLRAENDQSIKPQLKLELMRRLEDQFYLLMDNYAKPHY